MLIGFAVCMSKDHKLKGPDDSAKSPADELAHVTNSVTSGDFTTPFKKRGVRVILKCGHPPQIPAPL